MIGWVRVVRAYGGWKIAGVCIAVVSSLVAIVLTGCACLSRAILHYSGNACYIVREVRLVREREREREREIQREIERYREIQRDREIQRERDTEREREREGGRERDGSDVTIVALKLMMSLHFPLPKNRAIGNEFTLPLAKNSHFSFLPSHFPSLSS